MGFLANCSREIASATTAKAAIAATITGVAVVTAGAFDVKTAVLTSGMYVAGHIVARAQARGEAGTRPSSARPRSETCTSPHL